MNINDKIRKADEKELNMIWSDMLFVRNQIGEHIRKCIKDRYRELDWNEYPDWDALWGDMLWETIEELGKTKSENDMAIKIMRDLQSEKTFIADDEPFDAWLFSRLNDLVHRGIVKWEQCSDSMPEWMLDEWMASIFAEREEGLKDRYWDAKIMEARGK